jgi:hypothetical protein
VKRIVRSSLVAAVAVLGVAACTSNPGPKTVAEDVVDGLVEDGDLTTSQQDCLQEKLNGYSDDQLNAIAVGNEELDYGPDFDIQSATPAFQEFVADLETCMGSSGG